MKKTVVRVALDKGVHRRVMNLNADELFLILQHIGVIKVHRDDEMNYVFDVTPPRHVNALETWAEMSAKEFESYGHNAVAAPEAK